MGTNTKAKSKTDAAKQFRNMVEKSATQSKEVYEKMSASKEVEKMSAATGQTADIIRNCYLAAVKGVQDYNNKLIEFTHANTKAAFDFAQRMSGVKSPSEFVELSTRACTAAAYDPDRADQATRGACPAGAVRDCGAAEDTTSADVHLRFIRRIGKSDLAGTKIRLLRIANCHWADVRFGSKADICSAKDHVRSTPESGHVRCN